MNIDKILDYAFRLWGEQLLPEVRVTREVGISFLKAARDKAASIGEEYELMEGYRIGLRKLSREQGGSDE